MKTLVIVRHAKSSWDNLGQADMERPLNDRGKKDAPEMARRLKEKLSNINLFVTSPAKRAHKTAKLFAEVFGVEKESITVAKDLYDAAPNAFFATVASLPKAAENVVLFSHNPGITEFANLLTNVHVDDMPTCAMFAVSADVDNWEEFKQAEKKFLFFDYPKNPIA